MKTRFTIFLLLLPTFLTACQESPEELKVQLGIALYNDRIVEAKAILERFAKRKISLNGMPQPYLHTCSKYGNLDAVKLLVGHGCDVNERDKEDKRTPLHWAAKNHPAVVKYLLESGAEVDAADQSNATPLDIAVSYQQPEAVKLLLARGATIKSRYPGGSSLHTAAYEGDVEILAELLKYPHDINQRNEFGLSPLEAAALNHHKEAAALLLAKGAEMTLPTAIMQKKFDWVVEQVKIKPDLIRWKRSTGETLLHLACQSGDEKILKFLLSSGANPLVMDLSGEYPFHEAARHDFLSAVQMLMSPKVVEVRNMSGETPLHIAVKQNHQSVVEYLLQEKCNPNSRDKEGDSILLSACKENNAEIGQLLLSKGADPNCMETRTLATPLHYACSNNNLALTKALIRAGALLRRNRYGQTPIAETNDPAILNALQNR